MLQTISATAAIIAAGVIALSPISPLVKPPLTLQPSEQQNEHITDTGQKKGERTTTTHTIREGFKGHFIDGQIVNIPYRHETTIEKTYNETIDTKDNANKQSYKESSEEGLEEKSFSITRKIYNGTKTIAKKIWKWI